MKRKFITIISICTLVCVVISSGLWYQYETTRLQPYYKLYYAIENQCQAALGNDGYYDRQTSRDNGKRVNGHGVIFFGNEKYQLSFQMQNDKYSIIFYQGFSQQIIDGELEISNAPGYYEYVYDKVSNDLSETYNWDSKIAYPPQSLISAFEKEIAERLKSC